MTHHMAVASESVDQTLGNITWIADPILGISAAQDNLRMGNVLRALAGIMFGAPTIDSARIVAPSLYKTYTGGGPDFSPLNVGAEPLAPTPWIDFRAAPIVFEPDDDVNAQISNSGAGSAEDAWAIALLANGPIAPVAAAFRTFKFTTAASALTAEAWNNRALTAAQSLQPGTYAVGGGYGVSTSGRACRLVFRNQSERPGFLMGDTESDVLAPSIFRNGGLGIYGTFKHTDLPSVDIFADAADNEVQEIYLDLIKVA